MRRTPKQREMNNPATLFRNKHTEQTYEDFLSLAKLTTPAEYTQRAFLSNFRSVALRLLVCAYSEDPSKISEELYNAVLNDSDKAISLFENQLNRQKNASAKISVLYSRIGNGCRMLTTKETADRLCISRSTAMRYFNRCLSCLHSMLFQEEFQAAMLNTKDLKKTSINLSGAAARTMQTVVDAPLSVNVCRKLCAQVVALKYTSSNPAEQSIKQAVEIANAAWHLIRTSDNMTLLSKWVVRMRLEGMSAPAILQAREELGMLSKPLASYKNPSRSATNAWKQFINLLSANIHIFDQFFSQSQLPHREADLHKIVQQLNEIVAALTQIINSEE